MCEKIAHKPIRLRIKYNKIVFLLFAVRFYLNGYSGGEMRNILLFIVSTNDAQWSQTLNLIKKKNFFVNRNNLIVKRMRKLQTQYINILYKNDWKN